MRSLWESAPFQMGLPLGESYLTLLPTAHGALVCACASLVSSRAHTLRPVRWERAHTSPGGNFSQWESQSICFRNLHVCTLGAHLAGGGCHWSRRVSGVGVSVHGIQWEVAL